MPQVLDGVELALEVNNEPVRVSVSPTATLLDLLREGLELNGAKLGCGEGEGVRDP